MGRRGPATRTLLPDGGPVDPIGSGYRCVACCGEIGFRRLLAFDEVQHLRRRDVAKLRYEVGRRVARETGIDEVPVGVPAPGRATSHTEAFDFATERDLLAIMDVWSPSEPLLALGQEVVQHVEGASPGLCRLDVEQRLEGGVFLDGLVQAVTELSEAPFELLVLLA